MGIISMDPEDRKAVAERIAAADGPITWSWMALRDEQDGKWSVPLLAVRGATRSRPLILTYRRIMLGSEQLTPRQASQRFLKKVVRPRATAQAPALKVDIPDHSDFPQWITTEADFGRYLSPPGRWPTYSMNFSLQYPSGMPGLLDPLKGKNLPFYPTLQAALSELLYGVPPRTIGANISPNVLVRLPDLRARLSAITLRGGRIRIAVEEGKPNGSVRCRLQAAWRSSPDDYSWHRQEFTIRRSRQLTVDAESVPAEMWFLLSDPNGFVLDRIGWSADIGSQIEAVGSLSSRVERWLTEGEHYRLEYKQEIGDRKVNESFAETIAAFANGAGGVVLIGVTDDSTVVGFDPSKVRDQIVDLLRTRVTDPVTVNVDRVVINRKPVWVVTVPPQPDTAKPFRSDGRVMVRANGTTRVATTSEHRSLVAESVSRDSRLYRPSWASH